MSTHPICQKCNSHFAVYGSDYCHLHGGVVPKTIAEYEDIKQRLEVEPKSDRLESTVHELDSVSKIQLLGWLETEAGHAARSGQVEKVQAYNEVIGYLCGD